MFRPDGLPVRAKVSGHLQRVPQRRPRGEGGQARDGRLQQDARRRPGRDVERHRRAASTRPATWRPIAILNGIDDPRSLAVGRQLLVPQLPFRDPETGEVHALTWRPPRCAYAPDFRVTINGSELPSALRQSITSIRYEDGTQAADRVEVGHRQPGPPLAAAAHPRARLPARFPPASASARRRHLDARRPACSTSTTRCRSRSATPPGPLEEVFKGDITGVQASFPSGGMPTMTIVAHDYLHRMTEGKYARAASARCPTPSIAAILSAENLLIPSIDPAVIAGSTAVAAVELHLQRHRAKAGRGERSRAPAGDRRRTYDADFWVDGDFFYFSRFIKEYSPRLTLHVGRVAARLLAQGEHGRAGRRRRR